MFRGLLVVLCGIFSFSMVHADEQMLKQPQVQAFIHQMVKEDKFDQHDLIKTIRQAKFQKMIIEKMDKPYEAKPWDVYQQLFLTSARIEAGRDFWKQHHKVLTQAEKKFGVPASIIVGILGVETIYGRQQGGFRVLDALTTLGFYYPKRSPYFLYELRQFLLMCRENNLQPDIMVGSYAGAMGQAQFMPSSYRRWAMKYQGTGAPDIIHNADDAIFSIANYLQRHGWKSKDKIADKVDLQGVKCEDIEVNLKHATYDYQHLVHCGFKPKQFAWSHPKQAGILELMQSQGLEYWIGYPNFYVVLTYNSSPLYGLAVYLLGNAIASKV